MRLALVGAAATLAVAGAVLAIPAIDRCSPQDGDLVHCLRQGLVQKLLPPHLADVPLPRPRPVVTLEPAVPDVIVPAPRPAAPIPVAEPPQAVPIILADLSSTLPDESPRIVLATPVVSASTIVADLPPATVTVPIRVPAPELLAALMSPPQIVLPEFTVAPPERIAMLADPPAFPVEVAVSVPWPVAAAALAGPPDIPPNQVAILVPATPAADNLIDPPAFPLLAADPNPAATPDAPAITPTPVLPPTIDTIALDGSGVVEGDGPAGAAIKLYLDDVEVGDAVVEAGRWHVEDVEIGPKPTQELRVDALDPATGKLMGTGSVSIEMQLPAAPPTGETDTPADPIPPAADEPAQPPPPLRPSKPNRASPSVQVLKPGNTGSIVSLGNG